MSVYILLVVIFGIIAIVSVCFANKSNTEKRKLHSENLNLNVALESKRVECVSLERIVDDAKRTIAEMQIRNDGIMSQLNNVREENARLRSSLQHFNDEQQYREEQLETRFKNLANEILKQNSMDFKTANEERLNQILNPLKLNLEEFKKTVTDTYNNEARERFSLQERIRELVELNQNISREARELSEALRGNSKVQGDWGEMVLESILEKSGLQKDEEYFIQATTDQSGNVIRNEEGKNLRPDVVVKYPDGRYVIIDSKVSLKAFVDYVNADDEETKKQCAMRHVRSVRNHIDELARKSYQDYIGESKLDFVMMFIPNEPAYIAAMRIEPTIWQEAYDNKVLIVSPTHLVSGLRLIAQLWSRDKYTKNAIKIAEEAGKMYDKFADFTSDMEKIEKAISSTQKAYNDAMNKLTVGKGNLVSRAQKMHALGVKASKQLSASTLNSVDDSFQED
ncbi:MAG: DNA recombination protein RmuC [Muribaculaceae bacterium]|nr:DNA recombination protein RmuC [Muribaculaceae bacterium]